MPEHLDPNGLAQRAARAIRDRGLMFSTSKDWVDTVAFEVQRAIDDDRKLRRNE